MTRVGTAKHTCDAVRNGEQTAVDVCRAAFDVIAARDPALGAFTTLVFDRALARAEEIDAEPERWRSRALVGLPVALKDNLCTRGIRTTASSRILESYVPPYDATVVQRLEAAGAVVVGKTNCDEFAMGSSTENSAFQVTCNPWALDRIPGGSSGGSAVAVAAGMTPVALGSDTGGSIRQPAAHCGIVGLKPTYGRVSRYGLLAFASSLDQVGPLTHSAVDAAMVLDVIAGADPADATSSRTPVGDYLKALDGRVRGLRIGIPRRLLETGVDADVMQGLENALAVLRERGATLVEVDLEHASAAIPVYYLIATAEASSNLARYDGVRYGYRAPTEGRADLAAMYALTRAKGFGAEVKRRIMLGTYVLSAGYYDAYYLKAQQVRTLIRTDYDRALEQADILAMPTAPTPPFKLGERVEDPLQMYLGDVFTVGANLTGLPAISVPCGFAGTNLPLGLQLIGRPFDEATLLRVADAYERDTPWSTQHPPIS
jgi:aspartyl-tRNA(Asn)/glutamyl-tRNA(Gln) amidotransferase subunit A